MKTAMLGEGEGGRVEGDRHREKRHHSWCDCIPPAAEMSGDKSLASAAHTDHEFKRLKKK